MDFVNRERELTALDEMWTRPGSQFLVLYGRRRVGKTTLMLHWGADKPTIFWTARRTSTANLLRDFSQAIYRFEHPEIPPDSTFTYPSWEMALRQVARLATEGRILLVLSEHPRPVAAGTAHRAHHCPTAGAQPSRPLRHRRPLFALLLSFFGPPPGMDRAGEAGPVVEIHRGAIGGLCRPDGL
jgi:hypothetical protein